VFDGSKWGLATAAGAATVDARRLRDFATILHNAAQLHAFEAMAYLDELPQALDNVRETVALQAALAGLARECPLPEAQAQVPDLLGGLVGRGGAT